MIVLVGARRAGKTYKIIESMQADPNIVMVCASVTIADMTRREYPDMAGRIFGPNREALRCLGPNTRFVIDNADLLLDYTLGRTIHGATLTGKGVTLPCRRFIVDCQ